MKTRINILCLVMVSIYSLPTSAQGLEEVPWDDPGMAVPPPMIFHPLTPPAYEDPAITRRSIFPSAETLPGGAIEFTCRGLLSTELAFGVTDWLELNVKNIPVFMLIEEIGVANTLWSGGLRLRLLKSEHFTLTTHADGFSVLGWAGIHAGLTTRLGTNRFSFHGTASGIKTWQVNEMESDNQPAPFCEPGNCSTSSGSEENPTVAALLVSGGVDVRVHRKVKLLADVSYYRDATMDMLTLASTIRLHGKHFATDLGLMLVRTSTMEIILPIPLVNFSVAY